MGDKMNTTYKKLFDIKYNNKTFTIFIDNNHRRTFLEKNELGEYIYPTLEDFKVLNNIYNIHNPLIEYDLRKYVFKEKVRLTSGVLAITLLATALGDSLASNFKNYHVEETEDSVIVTSVDAVKAMNPITDLKELDSILGYSSVTKERVLAATTSNPNLNDYYKEVIYNLVNRVYEEYPSIDLRVFYENVKTLEIRELPENEFHEEFNNYSVANYESSKNRINFSSNANLQTIYHEFIHAMWSFYWPEYGVYRVTNYSALNEAMTNQVTSLLSSNINTYTNEGLILDYLMSFTDYTYEDYTRYGIEGLISTLKEKYPSIDIDYICDCTNTIKDTTLNLGLYISLQDCDNLLDELFSLSLLNVNEQNSYEPFTNFVRLLKGNQELFDQYLERYNSYLTNQNYSIITKDELNTIIDEYQDFSSIAYTRDNAYIVSMNYNDDNTYSLRTLKGLEVEQLDSSEVNRTVSFRSFETELQIAYLKDKNLFGTQAFWNKMIADYDKTINLDTKTVPIYINGEFLCNEQINNLKIQIGLTQDREIGFMITNNENDLIYTSSQTLLNVSNYVNLASYMQEFSMNNNKLELSYILNKAYLLEIEKNNQAFKNIEIDNKEITITPLYILSISDTNTRSYLNYFTITKEEDGTILWPVGITLDIDYDGEDISLYTILSHYNLLTEEKQEYSFTEEEIKNLITNYIDELKETKAR